MMRKERNDGHREIICKIRHWKKARIDYFCKKDENDDTHDTYNYGAMHDVGCYGTEASAWIFDIGIQGDGKGGVELQQDAD